jgi:hypothetical protein
MSETITKGFVTKDPRFDLVEKLIRALLPGGTLVAKYAADVPRGPDIPAPPPPPGSAPITDYPGDILDEAVPERVELTFMPPPGLDFDSRHILFGLFEAAECVDTARGLAWKALVDEIEAWTESASAEPLPATVVAVSEAIHATWDAAEARRDYLVAKAGGIAEDIAAAPKAESVIELDETAARLRVFALNALRNEESLLLAPVVADRDRGDAGAVTVPLGVDVAATAESLAASRDAAAS